MNFLQLRSLSSANNADLANLILRIGVFVALIIHGVTKLIDIPGTAGFFGKVAIANTAPTFWAVLVGVFQVIIPVLILIGLFTRWAGFGMAFMFAFIMIFGELGLSGWAWVNERSGGWGFEGGWYYFVIGIVLMLAGAGKYSLDHKLGERHPYAV